MELNKNYYDYITSIVYVCCGIDIQSKKPEFLENRLYRRFQYHNFVDVKEYCEYLKQDNTGIELNELINSICTNTTEFFREQLHFDFLNDYFKKLAFNSSKNIYVWSAACSSGEEPYSIAMSAIENLSNIKSRDFKLLATDIDTAAISEALNGTYNENRISKINKYLLNKYFKKSSENEYKISDEVRKYIYFRRLNLIEKYPFDIKFDVIFCRNVLIYFDLETRKKVIDNLCRHLKSDGILCIGHTESLNGLNLDYSLKYIKPSIYQIKNV